MNKETRVKLGLSPKPPKPYEPIMPLLLQERARINAELKSARRWIIGMAALLVVLIMILRTLW